MYKRYILKNGLKIIYEYIPYVKSISIGAWIKSGSRFESEKNNGVSHFIEHMLFKGTHNRTSKEISEEIESLGGQINAFTSRESTCYYVKLLDTHFDTGIDVLSDMIINPKFHIDDIEKEKSVILEEINMYEDLPEDVVTDLQFKSVWGEESIAYPILGTFETITNLSREDIIDYHTKIYTPENTVISVAGNFNEEDLLKHLEDKFSLWDNKKEYHIAQNIPSFENNILVKNKNIEQVHVALTLRGIESGNKDIYTLLAINSYFGGGTSSKLFQKIREEKGFVYTIYSYPSSYKNTGIFTIYFACNPQYVDEAICLIKEEIHNLYINKITSEKLDILKEQLKGNYILGLEGVSNIMFGLGKAELILNRVHTPDEVLNNIDKITIEDVNRVLEHVFSDGILSAAVVGKDITEDKIISLVRS